MSLDNRDTASTIFWLVMALVSGPLAVSITPEITVTQTGIRSSAPWGSEKIEWNDIARVKPMPAKRIFKVISSRGESVTIHTRSRDYPAFIELLCQQRPDLFEADAISPGYGPGMIQDFRSERIFRKGFFRQYLPALGGIIFCPLMILAVPDGNMNWNFTSLVVVSLLIALDGLLILMPFFAVHTIKLEPNKLTLSTFFGDREIPTSRIQEIKINQVYGQMDRVWNYVHIRFTDKKRCGLGGFAEGAEIIYGSLMNWWNTYKSK